MTDYKVQFKKAFSYRPTTGDIAMGIKSINPLSDNEQSEYIADSLTHEHIHKILHNWFNSTTSQLFDGVQQYFRNTQIHEKLVNDVAGKETYHTYIAREGYQAFLNKYLITKDAFNQAYIITGGK